MGIFVKMVLMKWWDSILDWFSDHEADISVGAFVALSVVILLSLILIIIAIIVMLQAI